MKRLIVLICLSLLLAGCGVIAPAQPTPLPTIVLDSGMAAPAAGGAAALVTASGSVVPAQAVQLASVTGGGVQAVAVTRGQQVPAGAVLVTLAGRDRLTAALEAASLELLSAQKALADLKQNAELDRAQAQLRLAQAKDALDKATRARGWKQYRVGDDNQIDVARANLILAQDALDKAEERYSSDAESHVDSVNKAAALSALAAARQARDKAQANLNYLLGLPGSVAVEEADAVLAVARATLTEAQLEFDRLKDGPDAQTLALAEGRVSAARSAQAAAQTALNDLELKAPFAGTVSRVNVQAGEWAAPGQVIVALADVEHLQVETSDLSERDVASVKVGQQVRVSVKALGVEVKGHVIEVAPLAETLGGDVVYPVRVELDERPADLRAGMSVEVDFLQE